MIACIDKTAMNGLQRTTFSLIATLPLLSLPLILTGCGDSSSDTTEVVEERIWTLTADDFATGDYALNLSSVHGPPIELVPEEGGTQGVMRVDGVSTPVSFFYAPMTEVNEEVPSSAVLEMRFNDPASGSVNQVLAALGVTLLLEDGSLPEDVVDGGVAEPVPLPEGSSIEFLLKFTPFTSVQAVVTAMPSVELENVYADWPAFDDVTEENELLSSWVLLDMLRTDFTITKQ